MTLQQFFLQHCDDVYVDKEVNAEYCEEIADKFAIDFFNWAKSYQSNDRNNWGLSSKQLLEIYKKEKWL